MPRGLNTDLDPRNLPEGSYPVFLNMTGKTGHLKPRPGTTNLSLWPTSGTYDYYLWSNAQVSRVERWDPGEDFDGNEYGIHCSYGSSGIGVLHEFTGSGLGNFDSLVFAPPAAPTLERWQLAAPTNVNVLLSGQSRTYATREASDIPNGGQEIGTLGDTLVVTNDVLALSITVGAGTAPSPGDTLTNTTKSGATAPAHDVNGTTTITVAITEGEKSSSVTWQSGDAITWASGSGTMTVDEAKTHAQPGFLPDGASDYWALYALDNSGTWRRIGGPFTDTTTIRYDNTYFPYASITKEDLLPAYDGPVDQDGLVETGSTQVVDVTLWDNFCVHRGVILAVVDRYVYPSEPYLRTFVKDRRFDLGAKVTAIVPRDEYVEIYTAKGLQILLGDYPNQVLRPIESKVGPLHQRNVVATPRGTFFFGWDDNESAVYRWDGTAVTNITQDVVGSLLQGMTDTVAAGGVALGADDRALYIALPKTIAFRPYSDVSGVTVAQTAFCLGYDFTADEWWEFFVEGPFATFAVTPKWFGYDDANHRAVMIGTQGIGVAYFSPGNDGGTAYPWEVVFQEVGGARYDELPEWFLIDMDGDADLSIVADGETVYREEVRDVIDEEMIVPLPFLEAKKWHFGLNGSAAEGDVTIRDVTPNG